MRTADTGWISLKYGLPEGIDIFFDETGTEETDGLSSENTAETEAEIETETESVEEAAYTQTEEESSGGSAVPYFIGGGIGFVIGVIIAGLLLFLYFKKTQKKKFSTKKRKSSDDTSILDNIGSTKELASQIPEIYIGKVHDQGARENQQDSFAVSPLELVASKGILAVVADGMGGLSAGERVSQTAVSAMIEGFMNSDGEPQQLLLSLLKRANSSVNRMLGPANYKKSGSTMVAALIKNGRFNYISIGDSRIALLRGGVLYQLNRDHIYSRDLALDAINGKGTIQAAFNHPKAQGLTSFLGMGSLKYVDMPSQAVDLKIGDRFILMSDGVYNALTEEELKGALGRSESESAEYLNGLIQSKNYKNQDNYTAVIITVRAASFEEQ